MDSYRTFGNILLNKLRENNFDDVYRAGEKKTRLLPQEGETFRSSIQISFPGLFCDRHLNRFEKYTYDCVVIHKGKQVLLKDICNDLASQNKTVRDELYKLVKHTAKFPLHDVRQQEVYNQDLISKQDMKYSPQELVDIMSYIGIIEEFNYPQFNRVSFRGRTDCFGRFIESVCGGVTEYNKQISQNLFNNGAIFYPQRKYEDYYCSVDISKDRWTLNDF